MSTLDPRTPPRHLADDDLIDLVNGLLEAPARERMVAHAAGCADCDARLREVAGAHERGRARAPEVPAVAMVSRHAAGEPSGRGARGVRRAAMMLAAAGVLAVAGITYVLRSPGESASPASHARHTWLPAGSEASAGRRSAGDPADSLVLTGLAAYERRDLAATEALLTTPATDGALEWVRRLYLANTLLALDRPAEALPLIESPEADFLPEPWRGELQWTYLVALSRVGRHADADSVLRLVLERDDEIGVRARALPNGPTSRR